MARRRAPLLHRVVGGVEDVGTALAGDIVVWLDASAQVVRPARNSRMTGPARRLETDAAAS